MDERLKILLGSEDIVARDNEDLYININLNRSFFEYKREKYDNDFDLAKQFDKERNLSRNFRIYGIVDSNVIDTNNLSIKAYYDSGTTKLASQTSTTSMNFNSSINVFNKKKGKYYISLDNYSGSSVYLKIQSNNNNIATQVFEQKLVFDDFDGVFIPYGTETVEVDDNLNTIEINNNFPFFYNKHWVKKNISLQETKYPIINFSGSSSTIYEGQTAKIVVYLDKPSPFGNEKVDFLFLGGSADASSDILVSLASNPSVTFSNTFQISFSPGQKSKVVNVLGSPDFLVETLENYKFGLGNFLKVKSGTSLNYEVQIENSLPRQYAIYELSNLFENRTPFLGLTAVTNSSTFYPTPSIIRNGLHYNGLVNEFYPIDEVNVEIENLSNSTSLLPFDSNLGNQEEAVWSPGEIKYFTIKPEYSSSVLNEVSIYLPPSLNRTVDTSAQNGTSDVVTLQDLQSSLNLVLGSISINGFDLPFSNESYQYYPNIMPPNGISTSYEAFKLMLNNGSLDVYANNNLYKPFTIITDDSNYTIKLKAKSSGVRLDVNTNIENSQLSVATATTITAYSYPTQNPFVFKLLGNESNGDVANYKITFRKSGYKALAANSIASTSVVGQMNYLITCLDNVLHNWDVQNNRPIAFSGNPIQGDFLNNKYFLNKGKVYYQGLVMLGTSSGFGTNLTAYGTQSEFGATWNPNPINVIERTDVEISNQSASQVSLLKINTPAPSSSPVITTADTNFYSFDYRNGTTDSYSTFYWNGANNANLITNGGSSLKISGSTAPRNSPGLKYEIDQGIILGSQVIPVGPVDVTYPGYNTYEMPSAKFYSPYYPTTNANNNVSFQNNGTFEILLSAKSPGIPFTIKNIVNNNPNAEIVVMPVIYDEKNGVTSNPYNNKMGGFSLTTP
jgi:hypothetical protein